MLVIPVRVVASHANMHSDHEVFREQRQKGIQKSVEKGRWLQEGPKTDGVPRTPRQTTGSFIQSVHEGEKTDSSGNEIDASKYVKYTVTNSGTLTYELELFSGCDAGEIDGE